MSLESPEAVGVHPGDEPDNAAGARVPRPGTPAAPAAAAREPAVAGEGAGTQVNKSSESSPQTAPADTTAGTCNNVAAQPQASSRSSNDCG